MEKISVNFTFPEGWQALSDSQLQYIYDLIAADFNVFEIKTLCLLRWNKASVIGKNNNGSYLLKCQGTFFELDPIKLAEILENFAWVGEMPGVPIRPEKMDRCKAIHAAFQGVPFETFIVCDNYFQGYMQTKDQTLLDEIGKTCYPGIKSLKQWQRIAVLYWIIGLKDFFSRKFPDFFVPARNNQGGNLLGPTPASVEAAMNAQIRALTKGDITKEAEVLGMDTWRALTELDALAKEYKDFKEQSKK